MSVWWRFDATLLSSWSDTVCLWYFFAFPSVWVIMLHTLVANVESVEESNSCRWTDSWNVTAGIKQICVVCKISEECVMPRACQITFIWGFEAHANVHTYTYQQSRKISGDKPEQLFRRHTQGHSVDLKCEQRVVWMPYMQQGHLCESLIGCTWVQTGSIAICYSYLRWQNVRLNLDCTINPLLHCLFNLIKAFILTWNWIFPEWNAPWMK